MLIRHTTDDLVERYSMGRLATGELAEVEEHLLQCAPCRRRVEEADEFLASFRIAAVQPDARPLTTHARRWAVPPLYWATAAAAATLFILVPGTWHTAGDRSPAVLEMQSLRGPESGVHVAGGRELLLAFDVLADSASTAYEMEIVDAEGGHVKTAKALVQSGRVMANAGKLPKGAYWVRVYSLDQVRDLRAEYGLTIE